jgi:hypothetical protein
MRVTFLSSFAMKTGKSITAYAPGEHAELDEALAERLIARGIAQAARGRPPGRAERTGARALERMMTGPDETERLV